MDIKIAYGQTFGHPGTPAERRDPFRIAQLRRACPALQCSDTLRRASDVLLHFPRIAAEGQTFFGGNQGWYGRKTQRMAGCGPVAGANIAACMAAQNAKVAEALGVRFAPDGRLAKANYLQLMQEVYRVMGTLEIPLVNLLADRIDAPKRGLISSFGQQAAGFALGVLRHAKKHGVYLQYTAEPAAWLCYNTGLQFIKNALAAGAPVALLTTFNRHPMQVYWQGYSAPPTPVERGMARHFVTLTGVRYEPCANCPQLLASSWGRVCVIDYASLHKSWQSPKAFGAALLYFEKSAGPAETNRQIIAAHTLLAKLAAGTMGGAVRQIGKRCALQKR